MEIISNPISFGHSFNQGDLITLLPSVRHICNQTGKMADIYQRLYLPAHYYQGAVHPVTDENGTQVCMNDKGFEMLKPLIEYQAYINFFMQWKGEPVNFDINKTRTGNLIPLPHGSIYKWCSLVYPELECDYNEAWLSSELIKDGFGRQKIIINRTQRYTNGWLTYFFLKEYQDEIIFAGTETERKIFCEQFELEIPLLQVKDFLELAGVISGSRFFMGNQSFCYQLAEGQKIPRMLELCFEFPNVFPSGKDGYCFLTQQGLEYNFKRLYNDTK